MHNRFRIRRNEASLRELKFDPPALRPSVIQKKNDRRNIIVLFIAAFLGLTINTYSFNIQNPGIVLHNIIDFNLVIQVGAFRKETNATVFKEKLSALIDKQVILVVEEGYYKVQLTGFKTIEDIEKIIPALGLIGIKDFWIPPAKKDTEIPDYSASKPDTIQDIFEEKIVNQGNPETIDSLNTEESPAAETTYALEIGAYRQKNRALDAQKKVVSKLKLHVEIVEQWNRYHVIITGFTDKAEINRCIPELARLGYDKLSVIKDYGR